MSGAEVRIKMNDMPALSGARPVVGHDDGKPVVLVYRDILLSPSETFILAQAESFQRYSPVFVGSRRVPGLSLPSHQSLVAFPPGVRGQIVSYFHKRIGRIPRRHLEAARYLPSLIHAHFGQDGVWALPLARRLGLPLLVTFHGSDANLSDEAIRNTTRYGRVYLNRRNQLMEEAAGFLAVSDFVRDRMIERGFPASKIVKHYIGVDTAAFCPDPTVERSPIVLFVGRLVENKGCDLLIKAMAEVQRVSPDTSLVVIGDGPLRAQLEQSAHRTLGKYRFLGACPSDTVIAWMNRAKVLSVPSIAIDSGASEGFGIVFIEAQAMELPVVSFRTGGIPEAVDHGRTGLLSEPGDIDQLAINLLSLLLNEERWTQMSKAGRRRVKDQFDLQRQSVALEQLFDMTRTSRFTDNGFR